MTTKTVKPMLAAPVNFNTLQFPTYASAKLDGIRGIIINGQLRTRKLLPLPNIHVQTMLSHKHIDGWDGELIVGKPNAPDVWPKTSSGLMKREGMPHYTFWVFDNYLVDGGYEKRLKELLRAATLYIRNTMQICVLPQKLLNNMEELEKFEADVVSAGFEGVILRNPQSPYKFGRATVKEQYLMKLKRYQDAEGIVIGFVEEQMNNNEAKKDELGYTKRSSSKAGKTGKGSLGAFVLKDPESGLEFNVGTGMTAAQRAEFWERRKGLLGALVKYKFFPVGVVEAPRHPVFLGFRDRRE